MTLLLNSLIRILYHVTVHCGFFTQNQFLFPIVCLVFSLFRTLRYAPRQAPRWTNSLPGAPRSYCFWHILLALQALFASGPSIARENSYLSSLLVAKETSQARGERTYGLAPLVFCDKGLCVVSRFEEDRLPLFWESLSWAIVAPITFSNGSK